MPERVPDAAATLSQNLRAARIARGLSQQALAERAGMSVTGLQRVESGERWPRAQTLEALSHALECEVSHLFAPPWAELAAESTSPRKAAPPGSTRGRMAAAAPVALLPMGLDAASLPLVRSIILALCRLEPEELRVISELLDIVARPVPPRGRRRVGSPAKDQAHERRQGRGPKG